MVEHLRGSEGIFKIIALSSRRETSMYTVTWKNLEHISKESTSETNKKDESSGDFIGK